MMIPFFYVAKFRTMKFCTYAGYGWDLAQKRWEI